MLGSTMNATVPTPDFIKQPKQATWAVGDYAVVGTTCRSSVSAIPTRSTSARR
jgi:hypothetical protein